MVMQFHEMKEIDLKLTLLSGSEIELDNLVITPYTLKEIQEYGYSKYMSNLQWISLSVEDFINSYLDVKKRTTLNRVKDSLRAFDFYIKLGGKEMQDRLLEVIKMIFRNDDLTILEDNVIALDFEKLGVVTKDVYGNVIEVDEKKFNKLNDNDIKLIHRDNFDDIVKIVRLQNYLEDGELEDEEDAPVADEETRKLIEHMKKMREKVEKKKRQQAQNEDGNIIDLATIISAVSSKSNSINKFNIWDLTLYQLYDEYSRLDHIDNYEFSLQAMMAGAKVENLKHWASKLS